MTATFHTAPAGWHAIATMDEGDPVVVPLVGWLVDITPGNDVVDPRAFAHPPGQLVEHRDRRG